MERLRKAEELVTVCETMLLDLNDQEVGDDMAEVRQATAEIGDALASVTDASGCEDHDLIEELNLLISTDSVADAHHHHHREQPPLEMPRFTLVDDDDDDGGADAKQTITGPDASDLMARMPIAPFRYPSTRAVHETSPAHQTIAL
ncbi:hypothetical protein CYMTET_2532 [Cymbomonas tetramitiformis]|uniref:Uncharacterized protein n=1 Tax=Cymbomonas tetramitiformis TaxID=36881 RepID=A0AAE0H4Y5_9CHLO|nr:hypothetical protein CYMTET_2532 [Cymbomonas tetramitiformis]